MNKHSFFVALICIYSLFECCIYAETQFEYSDYSPISVSIDSTVPYVSINQTKEFTATALDIDCMRQKDSSSSVWSMWSSIFDNCSSGGTSSDYHMIWEATGGGRFSENDKYGTSATYTAPDYAEIEGNRRDVSIKVTSDDTNYGNDTSGFDDTSSSYTRQIKVWQVKVTAQQSGTISTNCDAGVSAVNWDDEENRYVEDETPGFSNQDGRFVLGWVAFGNPEKCVRWGHNTQFLGDVPVAFEESSDPQIYANPVISGFAWKNIIYGSEIVYVNGVIDESISTRYPETGVLEIPNTLFQDGDCRHPNVTGESVQQIYMLDGPGLFPGSNGEDFGISQGYTCVAFDKNFEAYVEYGGRRVSNICPWESDFTLVPENGKWVASSTNP